jgi:hypothetical protein
LSAGSQKLCRSGSPWCLNSGWSLLAVWGILFSYSVISTPVPGVNEPHYLCKAMAFADPNWCRADFFLHSAFAHYCFYLLSYPLTQLFSFDTSAIAGRGISLLVVAWGWCRLARGCGLTSGTTILAALLWLLTASAGSLSGEWIIGGYESKVPSWGMSFLAIACWMQAVPVRSRGLFCCAGICAGAAISLHPVVGVWTAIAVGLAELSCCWFGCTTTRTVVVNSAAATSDTVASAAQASAACGKSRPCLSTWLVDAAAFLSMTLIAALPGLIPVSRILLDDSIPVKDRDLASYIQVFWRLKHHMDPMEFPAAAWVYAGLVFVAAGICVMTVNRLSRTARVDDACSETRHTITGGWLHAAGETRESSAGLSLLWRVLIAAAGIAVVGVLIGWHQMPANQMQGWQWRAHLLKFYPFRLIDGLLPVVATISVTLLIQLLMQRWRIVRSGWLLSLNTVLTGCVLLVGWIQHPEVPAGYTPDQFQDWQLACDWMRINAPADALVLTPRESFSFKWYAQRAEYVTYKDCPQDARGIIEWNRRLWYLNGWTQKSSSDGRYDSRELQTLHQETGITFIVTRILGPFEDSPEYEGRHWRIYRIIPTE